MPSLSQPAPSSWPLHGLLTAGTGLSPAAHSARSSRQRQAGPAAWPRKVPLAGPGRAAARWSLPSRFGVLHRAAGMSLQGTAAALLPLGAAAGLPLTTSSYGFRGGKRAGWVFFFGLQLTLCILDHLGGKKIPQLCKDRIFKEFVARQVRTRLGLRNVEIQLKSAYCDEQY